MKIISLFYNNFKLLFLAFFSLLALTRSTTLAQGISCDTPFVETVDPDENFHAVNISGTTSWFNFHGNGNPLRLKIQPNSGPDALITQVLLFEGDDCDSLINDSLWNFAGDNTITLDLGNLTDSRNYYVQVIRSSSAATTIDFTLFLLGSVSVAYSLPPAYPPQATTYSACFHDDAPATTYDLRITLTIANLIHGSGNAIYVDCPPSAGVTFTAFTPVAAPCVLQLANTQAKISVASGNYSGTIVLYVRFSGCAIFNSSNANLFHIYTTGNNPPAISNLYACNSDNNYICPQVDAPGLQIVIPNGPTTPSYDDAYLQKYDIVYRYYEIEPTAGIADYFSLLTTPEPDIEIQEIVAVDPTAPTGAPWCTILDGSGPALVYPSTLYATFNAQPTNISLLHFNIGQCINSHSYLLYDPLAVATDRILIRERIKVTKVRNCIYDNFANNRTTYHLEIHCDHTAAQVCDDAWGSLNVNCKVEDITLGFELRQGQTNNFAVVSSCPNVSEDYSALITTSATTPSGTVEITKIEFNIDPLFDFTGIKIGGATVNFTNFGGHVTIIADNSWTAATGLENRLNPNPVLPGFPNSYFYTNRFVFLNNLPANNHFFLTLTGLHLVSCASLQACNNTFQLTSDDLLISFNTMCEMNDLTFSSANAVTQNLGWEMGNHFNGAATAYSPISSIATTVWDALITYTYTATSGPGIEPWSLDDNNGGPSLITCTGGGQYHAFIEMPQYYTIEHPISGNAEVDIIDPSTGVTVATQVPCTFTNNPPYNDYELDFSGLGLTNPAAARILVNVHINCTGVNSGADLIRIEYREICDNCLGCYRTYGCAYWSLYNHCGGPCNAAPPPIATSDVGYSFERATFGWASYNAYITGALPLPRATIAAAVSGGLDLVSFYESDIANVKCEGSLDVGGLQPGDQLNFDLEYIPPASTTSNIFAFQGGTLTIVTSNYGGPHTIPIAIAQATWPHPQNYLSGSHTLYVTPDLTYFVPTAGVTLGTILDDACTFRFEGNFKVTDPYCSAIPAIENQMQVFSSFSISNGATNYPSCDPNSSNVFYLKVVPGADYGSSGLGLQGPSYHVGILGTPYQGNACQLSFNLFTNVAGGRGPAGPSWIDDFPTEFRPVLRWPDNITIDVPHGKYYMNFAGSDPLNPTAGYLQADWNYPGFPGSQGVWGPNATNCNPITLVSDVPNDHITINLSGTNQQLAEDKGNNLQPREGLMLFLTRLCPLDPANGPEEIFLHDNPDNYCSYDNGNPPPPNDIYTHAYSVNPIDHTPLYNCVNACAAACTTSYNHTFNYSAWTAQERHNIDLDYSSPVFATTNPQVIPFYFDPFTSGSQTGRYFPRVWTYFTSTSATNPTFNLSASTGAIVNQLFIGPPKLYGVGNANFGTNYAYNQLGTTCNTWPNSCYLHYAYTNLKMGYTCSGVDPHYDPIPFRISYGNACDGFHSLSNSNGDPGDFGSNPPCLYQFRDLQLIPQGSNIRITNESISTIGTGSCLPVVIDFNVKDTRPAAIYNSTFNLTGPNYFALNVSGPNASTVHVHGTPNTAAYIYTFAQLSSNGVNPFHPNEVLDYNNLIHNTTLSLVGSTYLEYHVVYVPVCLHAGTYNLQFYFANIHADGACGNPVSYPNFQYPLPGNPFTYVAPSPNGCSTPPTVSFHNPSCFGSTNGYAWIPTIPMVTFTYVWNTVPVQGGQTATGLGAGTYTCSLTSQNPTGCNFTVTVTLTQPTTLTTTITPHNGSCNNANDGYAFAQPSGGTPNYTYTWNTVPVQNTQTATGLSPGIYMVTVTDHNGCTVTATTTLTQPSTVNATITSVHNETCFLGNDGYIIVNASGGAGGYTYQWTPAGGSGATTTNLYAGNYTCTVTDLNGCSAVTFTSITQPPQLIGSLTSIPPCSDSPTGSISVSASGGSCANYTYSWSTANGNGNTATDLSYGSYTVTVSDCNGCSIVLTETFTPTENLTVSAQQIHSSGCIGEENGIAVATATFGYPMYTYAWSPIGGNASTASNLGPGVYTVTVTDSHNCSAITTVTITPDDNCCIPPVYEIALTNAFSATDVPSGVINTTGNVIINGTFTINSNLTITNSPNILLGPGAKIVVTNGKSLAILYSELRAGCDQMWNRIDLASQSILQVSNSTIKDADHAVFAHDGSTLKITDSEFDRNVVGIETDDPSIGIFNVIGYDIHGCTFHHTTPGFLAPYSGQPLHGLNNGHAGIIFNNMTGSIGAAADPNFFDNLNCGIICNKSSNSIATSYFTNIHHYDNFYTDLYMGSAVTGLGIGANGFRTLIVDPYNNMQDCDYGVYTDMMNTGMKSVYMYNVFTGVYSTETNTGRTFGMTNCYIDAIKLGVHLKDNPSSGGMDVEHSYISTTLGKGACVYVEEYNLSPDNIRCNNNITVSDGSSIGIVLINTLKGIVEGNDVSCTSNSNMWVGISQIWCRSNKITCNTMYQNSIFYTTSTGLRSTSSNASTISCNHTHSTKIGFEFFGQNNITDWRANDMKDHWEGLRVDNLSWMGQQTPAGTSQGNLWNGSYANYGAENVYTGIGLSLSFLYIDASGNPALLPSYPVWDLGWVLPGTSPATCDQSSDCESLEFPGPGRASKTDTLIAKDSTLTPQYTSEIKSIAKQYLYEYLKANPQMLDSDSVMTGFYNAQIESQIGKLSLVNDKVSLARGYDNTFGTAISTLQVSTKETMDSLTKIDSIIVVTGDTTLMPVKLGLKDQIATIQASAIPLYDARIVAVQPASKLNEAVTVNGTVSSTVTPEMNEKMVNSIYFQTAAVRNFSFTEEQQSILSYVAHQCPLIGGRAVFGARFLYEYINPNEEYDDATTCAPSDYYRPDNSISSNSRFSLKPNPASESVTVNFQPIDKNSNCVLLITDIAGKLINEVALPCDRREYSFSILDLTPGMYIVKMISNNQLLGQTKLAISR